MPVIDIIIVIAIIVSVIIGLLRGFVKEAIAIAALLFAIWAALYFGPALGEAMAGWLESREMQLWFGRIFLFAVIVSLGALASWGLSKLVRVSLLAGMDRFLGSAFGFARGVLLIGLGILAGKYAQFDNDSWWLESMLIPHLEVVAEWIAVMAPQGYEIITPEEPADVLPVRLPESLIFSGDR
jgi:membrane protein required for colicin V production